MHLYKLQKVNPSAIDKWSLSRLWPLKKKKLSRFVNTIGQFTNASSIHSGFYQWRMIDDNQKRFIPHLPLIMLFFIACTLLCICPFSTLWQISVWDGAIALNGSHSMGDGQIFLKSLRDISFYKDLLNEPTWWDQASLWMRSSLMVRAPDCQCTSCNGPGFDPSIRRHSGIWGVADKAVLNIVRNFFFLIPLLPADPSRCTVHLNRHFFRLNTFLYMH